MTGLAETFASQLTALAEPLAVLPKRYLVAYSGGLDSTVLLHLTVALQSAVPEERRVPIVAVHIDHQLHEDSALWSAHCSKVATALGAEFVGLQADVGDATGTGQEAAARDARYAVIAGIMQNDDWLLSAHHREDQAETLLLNLLRGSGPIGLAGMPPIRPFSAGFLVRPLLHVDRAVIASFAADAELRWIEDPSNAQVEFDRNFLRNDIVPRLESRWPNLSKRVARSAQHAADAALMLQQLADIDLCGLGDCAARLPIDELSDLPEPRQRNVIRAAIRRLRLTMPTAKQMQAILSECVIARQDAQPLVRWPGASVRRYRNGLYLLPQTLPDPQSETVQAEGVVELGTGLGQLEFRRSAHSGLCPTLLERGLQLRTRKGGEEIKPNGQVHTHKLKKLLQEEGIVPWMRDRLPLLYSGDQLVAVGDLWLAADAVQKPGVGVHWIDPPALH